MSDVVVTCPKWFWWDWIAEGDAAGEPWTGEEWAFHLGGRPPKITAGERVYIVCRDLLRGYAPLVRLKIDHDGGGYSLIRRGGAVAVTIPQAIGGFRGFRYRWWDYAIERLLAMTGRPDLVQSCGDCDGYATLKCSECGQPYCRQCLDGDLICAACALCMPDPETGE